MAEQVKLPAETRSESGKGVARRLRSSGRVPAVVYGRGVDATPLHVDALDLYHALHTSAGLNALIRLQIDGDEHLTIARDVQRHPVRGDLVHVDFVALDPNQRIRIEVPVHITGMEDVASPGVVTHVLHNVPVQVRPLDIPDSFTLEVGEMVIGDVLRVEDIPLPEGAEFDIETDRTVVTINAPTVIEEDEEEEELPEGLAEIMAGIEGEDLTPEEIAERLEEARAEAEEAEEEPGEPAEEEG